MAEKTKGRVVKAKKIPRRSERSQITDALLSLCYYYPQYTLQEARKLPFKHVIMLLETAKKEKAAEYLQLTNIAAAPHTKKGTGVRKLLNEFKKVADG